MADNTVTRNLERMAELDFMGWNRADWDGDFARHHSDDVFVEVHGQPPTHGIREHIQAMRAFVVSTGGATAQSLRNTSGSSRRNIERRKREMNISLSDATAIVDRAISHADAMGVPMNIAVVDGGGYLIAFARTDKAILGSIDIALARAKTSILFNGPSENVWEYCKPGGPAPATEHTNGGLIPYAGGVALNNEDGELIGAIGVSGGLPEQDGEAARAGASLPSASPKPDIR